MGKGILHVRKAVLNIQADAKTKIFGDANPALTYTVTGFKNGETIDNSGLNGQPDLFTSATETSNVGTYTINVSKGNLNCKNYLFVFNNGTLAVTKAKLTVIAQDKSRIYGESNPDFT
ncbi:MAG: MBG domain-containing protein, partial [Chitinophagaceae bacterium]